jgi:hypothetical protein
MKKFSFLFIIFMASFTSWAQEPVVSTTAEPVVLKSKRGINILPEAKEWALGISADPFLSYTGNLFSTAGNTSPSVKFVDNLALANNFAVFGKYMVDAKTAYRVRFNASINSDITKRTLRQDEVTPDVNFPNFTQDWRKRSSQTIVLAAGYEKRRGSSRVQGIYGGEVILGYNNQGDTYEYGNPISQDFNAPTTITNFDFVASVSAPASSRKVEENFGTSLTVGARGFIGVEYFIGPKISLGCEFGYSFLYRSRGKSDVKSESWNSLTNSVLQTKTDVNTGDYSSFVGTSLDNLNGSINLLFYF